MKRFFCVLFVLLLTACGGGGGSSSPTQYSSDLPAGATTGTLQLQLNKATRQAAKSVALTQPQPGRARVVVTSEALRFKTFADVIFGADNPPISLPAATDYKVEVVLYANGTPKQLVSHGVKENVSVEPGVVRAEPIDVFDIEIPIATPPSVNSGRSFSVAEPSATVLAGFGLQSAWNLHVKTQPFTSLEHVAYGASTSHTNIEAPAVGTTGNLYYQGEFFISPDLLQAGESFSDWAFFTDAPSSSLVVGGLNTSGGFPVDTTPPEIRAFTVPSGKLGSITIGPLSISAVDNAGIAGYMITKSSDADPTDPLDGRWQTSMPTSYQYNLPVNHGEDNVVTLKAWVRDYKGNISAPVTKTVILNCSPVISSFTVPAAAQLTTTIPVTITAKGFDGNGVLVPDTGQLQYMVTETAEEPTLTDGRWAAKVPGATSFTTNYQITSVSIIPGVRQTVPLYAWVKDTSGTGHGVSDPVRNAALLWDIPQVTVAEVQTVVNSGTTVDVVNIQASAAPGKQITGYVVSESPFRPVVSAFGPVPDTYTFTGITSAAAVTKYLYIWAIDNAGGVSASKQVAVRLLAPL